MTRRWKGYKYVSVLQFDSVKCKEMKDLITKEYYWKIRKIKSKSKCRELHKGY